MTLTKLPGEHSTQPSEPDEVKRIKTNALKTKLFGKTFIFSNFDFLSASSHFYKRSYPSVGWLVGRSVGNANV